MLYVGDYGEVFRRRIKARDETGALRPFVLDPDVDVVVFRFELPDESTIDIDAEITDGPRGVADYLVELGVLSLPGPWHWQAIVTTATGEYSTEVADFTVHPRLTAPA